MTEHPASGVLRTESREALHASMVNDLVGEEQEWLRDSRDLMMWLAPYHDCARRLGLDVAAVFRAVANEGPESLCELVTGFGERTDITPKAFAFEVVAGPRGPAYRYTLP